MDDLSRLANMAEIIGAAVVIGGIFFAIVQMRQLRQQRRELAAIELFRFFGSPQFSRALADQPFFADPIIVMIYASLGWICILASHRVRP